MAITNGPLLNKVPSAQQQALSSNYIDFAGGATGWEQQYLPDLMEKEAEVFGQRTIAGFLEKVGAEEAMSADQVVWSEQSRLHLSYVGTVDADGDTNGTFTVTHDIDGSADGENGFAVASHGIRTNDIVLIAQAGVVVKALVVETPATAVVTVEPYATAALSTLSDGTATLLVIGSEYGKGQSYSDITGTAAADKRTALTPTFKSYSNKPIIMKDYYEVSGSDASQIGWVEVTGEEGQNGYLWYLKAEGDTRARFNDYLEMTMLEAEKTADASIIGFGESGQIRGSADAGLNGAGTEGLFAAIESRGNITSGVTGVNAATDLAEFDAILAEFDKQGAIEENMMFVNRATSLAIDDMLASMNSYGAGGTSYGVFDNDEDMALNLGFSGFRRGSYDFYKSDFRYLNDKATRGGINDRAGSAAIRGVMIPAGTSTVYDQSIGKNLKRPFLHVRYRASQTDNRKMKTWVTGSVGAATSALDAMQLHMLSERCLVTQGANNFMLMK